MNYLLSYWQFIAWFSLAFIPAEKISRSVITTFVSLWNGFLFNLFLLLVQVLCIARSIGLCTKSVVLSVQGKVPKTINNTIEYMIEEIIGYIRVSSREQADDTNALKQQRDRVIANGAKQIFEDVQKGRGKKRPSLDLLIELVKRGKIRKIIITRLDRISRSLTHLKELIKLFNEHNVELVVLDQKFDCSTAMGMMLLNILGALAEWEVDLLSERVKHGKKHQRTQQWANGSCPWGYKVVDRCYVLDQTPFLCLLSDRPDNDVELSQEDDLALVPGRTVAELARDCIDIFFATKGVRRALKAIVEKYGIAKTSAKFNGTDGIFHWTVRGFSLWLQNPVLDGHTAYLQYTTKEGRRQLLPKEQRQIVHNSHPDQRLFRDGEAETVDLFLQLNLSNASGAFQKNATSDINYRPFAYQTGLIYCQECGSRCTPKGSSTNTEYLYYACRHAKLGCNNHRSVKRRNIEEALIEALVEQSCHLNQGESAPDDTLPACSEALARLEARLAWLEQSPGFDPEIEILKQKTRQEIEEEKNPFLSADKVFDSSVEELIRAGNNLAIWHLLNNDEKVEIYRKLVHKIYIQDGRVTSVVFKQ